MSATAKTRFSSGLEFTRKDLQHETHGVAEGQTQTVNVDTLSPPLSEEERLLRKAAALRQNLTEALQPRLDAMDEALRTIHREIAALRPHLPSSSFTSFQATCALLLRSRVLLFEERSVQGLLREAAEAAVREGVCEATAAARWRKSNRRPPLTSFVDLQLFLCLPSADGVLSTTHSVSSSSAVIQHQLARLWRERRCGPLCDAFLLRFYLLKDVLFNWGRGWQLLPSCAAPRDANHKESGIRAVDLKDKEPVSCAWYTWEHLSDLDRLCSFSSLCSQHLTDPIVSALEQALNSEFVDVWKVVTTAT